MDTITEADILYFKRKSSPEHRRKVLRIFVLTEVLATGGGTACLLAAKGLAVSVNMGLGSVLRFNFCAVPFVSGTVLKASADMQGGLSLLFCAVIIAPMLFYNSRYYSEFNYSLLENMGTKLLPDKYRKRLKPITKRFSMWAMCAVCAVPIYLMILGILNLKLAIVLGSLCGMSLSGVMHAWENGISLGHNYPTGNVFAIQRFQMALTMFVLAIIFCSSSFLQHK